MIEAEEPISPNDGMFKGSLDHYRAVGESALKCVKTAMVLAGKKEVQRILDFGCGHGRILRRLRAEFPEAEITACDTNADGVAFCAENFGAIPVEADPDPGKTELVPGFDLIWVGSVLTHQPDSRWPAFLSLFESLLAVNGLLVFTTGGRHVANELRDGRRRPLRKEQIETILSDFDRTGFGFQEFPASYGPAGRYGFALASPSRVCAFLEPVPLSIVGYMERGWRGRQDVVACVKAQSGVHDRATVGQPR